MSELSASAVATINETSLFQSSISLITPRIDDADDDVGGEGGGGGGGDGPFIDENMLIAHLNELRQWQQTQQQTLLNDQVSERERLRQEKLKLYKMFGLNVSTEPDETDETIDNDDNNEPPYRPTPQPIALNEPQIICSPPIKMNLDKIVQNMAIRSKPNGEPDDLLQAAMQPENVIKPKPYLKRGEGLTSRFKISPDAFRLDNLPKYKYARRRTSAHVQQHSRHHQHPPQKQQHQSQQHQHKHQSLTTKTTTTTVAAAAVAIPSGEGHQNNVKRRSQSDALQLKLKPRKNCVTYDNDYDEQSQHRQQQQQSHNNHRVTDEKHTNRDTVLPSAAAAAAAAAAVVRYKEVKNNNLLTPSTKSLFTTPIRNRLQCQQNEINDLELFEHLERNLALNRPATTMDNSSTAHKDDLLFQVNLGLQLSAKDDDGSGGNQKNDSFVSVSNGEEVATDESKHVHFAVNATKFDSNNINNSNNNHHGAMDKYRLTQMKPMAHPMIANTSSPNASSTESFRKFKEKLFDRKLKQKFHLSLAKNFDFTDEYNPDDNESVLSAIEQSVCGSVHSDVTALTQATHAELKEQSDELQDRLTTLESEIRSFREQNIELTKAIREHDLIRLAFDAECRTARDEIEEERIRFEMYMHDEQTKLMNERIDMDRRTKELQHYQHPRSSAPVTRTERDEIVKLREQCANHERELANREQKHVAAQARMRAQLRTVEKDFKEMQFEVENLRRENKKLETENVRMRRQSNTKMLHEINKNISKLAPKLPPKLRTGAAAATSGTSSSSPSQQPPLPPHASASSSAVTQDSSTGAARSCSNRNAHKTVVAKVTMHRGDSTRHRIRSKSVPNLQQSEKVPRSTGTSPNTSEAENGFSDDDECLDHNVGYFGVNSHSSARKQSTNGITKTDPTASATANLNRTNTSCCSNVNTSNPMKRVIENPDGSKDIWYPNGNLKKISADSMLARMLYYNGDIKETNVAEGTIKYYYAETNTWHTTYTNGLEILEFPNGQTEHRHKDGTVEVHFPNGSVRTTCPAKQKNDGITEEWTFADGTNVIQKTNGERLLLMPNGQREIHTNGHKRREYPDGTVKIVYPDGSQESRYANGRVRLKDKDGKLIMDSETIFV